MTLKEACDTLHVDMGANDDIIKGLLEAIPGYIETTTGLKEEDQGKEPLVDVVSGFLLTQWYYADRADDLSLTRTASSLLKVISLKARNYEQMEKLMQGL